MKPKAGKADRRMARKRARVTHPALKYDFTSSYSSFGISYDDMLKATSSLSLSGTPTVVGGSGRGGSSIKSSSSDPMTSSSSSSSKVKKAFQIGDKVQLITKDLHPTDSSCWRVGHIGIVTKINEEGRVLQLDNRDDGHVNASEVVNLTPSTQSEVPLKSVILNAKKIEEIKAAISQVENQSQIFEDWGFSEVFEKGTAISMLFWGIPGTGKTLMAQAVADSIGAKLKIVGTADIQSAEPGAAERTIKTIFAEANRANKGTGKKTVLLFDECDSLLMDRNTIGVILAAEVNALLQELERYEGVIIFTTNRLGKLDPALERRITAKIEFEFPDKEARLKIWGRMIPKKAPIAKDVDYKHLSEFALVGGNIKNAVLNAARTASYKKLKAIDMACFLEAIEKEMRGIQSFIAEYEKQDHTSLANNLTRTTTGLSVDRADMKTLTSTEIKRDVKKVMKIGDGKKTSKLWDEEGGSK